MERRAVPGRPSGGAGGVGTARLSAVGVRRRRRRRRRRPPLPAPPARLPAERRRPPETKDARPARRPTRQTRPRNEASLFFFLFLFFLFFFAFLFRSDENQEKNKTFRKSFRVDRVFVWIEKEIVISSFDYEENVVRRIDFDDAMSVLFIRFCFCRKTISKAS